MTFEHKALSITLEKEEAGGREKQTETRRPVKGEIQATRQNGGKGGLVTVSYDAKGRELWDCEPRRPREGRATMVMAIQEGDSVLSVLPCRCHLACTCSALKSNFKMVWLGQPCTRSHISKTT